jgi:hypothetical protein
VSKFKPALRALFLGSLLIFTFVASSRAAVPQVSIKLDRGEPFSARVRVLFPDDSSGILRTVWFLDEFGSARRLSERVPAIGLIDSLGRKIAERKVLAGQRLDVGAVSGIEYRIQLKQAESAFDAAHVSWAGPNGGLLMLDDLLPQGLGREALVHLQMPDGWKAIAPGAALGSEQLAVANIEKTAIRVGPGIREVPVKTAAGEIRLGISGEWLFTDADAARMTASIADGYAKLLGKDLGGALTISLARFPFDAGIGQWEGDTRGPSVTIFSSDMPFRNQSLQRLHEQLRHEIFHLWIPNAVNLTGRYDWFYEGFALYQSLRTGVELNQIRFEDYLDTLARAYDIDAGSPRMSLADAARDRWKGGGTAVYARGMLVAMLCDLILLDRSKGKVSGSDVIREVFTAHRAGAVTEGNAAVIGIMRKRPELQPVIEKYIMGSELIQWDNVLRSAGIVVSRREPSTMLAADPKASGAAKRTLEKLGINNWRRSPIR